MKFSTPIPGAIIYLSLLQVIQSKLINSITQLAGVTS